MKCSKHQILSLSFVLVFILTSCGSQPDSREHGAYEYDNSSVEYVIDSSEESETITDESVNLEDIESSTIEDEAYSPDESSTLEDSALDANIYFQPLSDTTLHVSETLVCYVETPYEYDVDYSDKEQELIDAQVLPELEGYNSFSGVALYNSDESIFKLDFVWHYDISDSDDNSLYKQLTLEIYPSEPEDKTVIDEACIFDESEMQQTQVDNVTVYGDGNADAMARFLIFTLEDGSYCQIKGIYGTTCEDLVQVMEFLIENGVDYDAFPLSLE
jgi:hypothetical protein